VSGGVVIEENAFLGVNSTLRDHIKVGQYALIGAGSTVVEDVAPRAVYVGTKAKATGKDSLEIQL
jgi:acetyltransferase-like isoleucine patch superfamily enzyme